MPIECINPRLLTRGPLKIRIVKVETPSFFWVRLENGREDFEEFLEGLSRRMQRSSHLLHRFPHNIQLDEVVAIREGSRWQRGIVTQIDRGDVITVFLRDWGRTVQRPLFECYYLDEKFHQQPWQAIPCGLANTKPTGTPTRWSPRVNRITQLLLERRDAWMRIRATHQDEAAAVDLKLERGSDSEVDDPKQLLRYMGCAEHTDQRMYRG